MRTGPKLETLTGAMPQNPRMARLIWLCPGMRVNHLKYQGGESRNNFV